MISIQTNVDQFNAALREYAKHNARLDMSEAIVRQGVKLTWALRDRFIKSRPAKGAIRAERIAALAQGEGIAVRPSVRQAVMQRKGAYSDIATKRVVFGKAGKGEDRKGRNLQALAVVRELGLRERGRGFMAFASKMGGLRGLGGYMNRTGLDVAAKAVDFFKRQHSGRYGQQLGTYGMKIAGEQSLLELSYGGSKTAVGKAMQKPAFRREIAGALNDVREDMMVYVRRKIAEGMQKAVNRVTA